MVRRTPAAAQQLVVVRKAAGEHVVVSVDSEVDAFTLHLLEAELPVFGSLSDALSAPG
jgi:hypothetical protein